MNPSSHRATVIALFAASSLMLASQAFAAPGQPPSGNAHTNIILQHHGHRHASSGAHTNIILQHHGHRHAKGGSHTQIILQHHHRP